MSAYLEKRRRSAITGFVPLAPSNHHSFIIVNCTNPEIVRSPCQSALGSTRCSQIIVSAMDCRKCLQEHRSDCYKNSFSCLMTPEDFRMRVGRRSETLKRLKVQGRVEDSNIVGCDCRVTSIKETVLGPLDLQYRLLSSQECLPKLLLKSQL